MRLFDVQENFIRAIDVGSGGKLMNIVVENDEVSKVLLKKECFDTMAIFIPLNRILTKSIPREYIDAATQVASRYGAKIWLPTSKEVARCMDEKFQKVFEYCMMGYLICDNLNAAAEISNHPQYPLKVVTLEGDSCDPAGIMSGGFTTQRQNLFTKFQTFKELRRNFETERLAMSKENINDLKEKQNLLTEELRVLKAKKQELIQKAERRDKLNDKLRDLTTQIMRDNVEDIEKKIEFLRSRLAQTRQECTNIEAEMNSNRDLIQRIKRGGDVSAMLKVKLAELEKEEKDLKQSRQLALQQSSEANANISKEKSEIGSLDVRLSDENAMIVNLRTAIDERERFASNKEAEIQPIKVCSELIKGVNYDTRTAAKND